MKPLSVDLNRIPESIGHRRITVRVRFPRIAFIFACAVSLAVKHGLVRREQDAGRLHTFYLVNPDYNAALKKLLSQLLS